MSLNSYGAYAPDLAEGRTSWRRSEPGKPLVLLVKDQEDSLCEMRRVLQASGYRVIDTDNGQDAAKRARFTHPDLVLVDLDVPLLYEVCAARQIMKQAFLGAVPFVIVIHEEEIDPYTLMEVRVRRNEYVTRFSDYEQLGHLLGYLLPVGPAAA